MHNFFRGINTQEYWNEKHKHQGDLNKPYDFSDFKTKSLSYYRVAADFLKISQDDFRQKTLLDVGCSHGFFTAYLKEKLLPAWEIAGWDFGSACINSAQIQCPEVNYECRDVLLNPIDKNYGAISMFETIEHLAEGDNYTVLNTILEHCEHAIISTVDTQDDCFGEHISHYTMDTFEEKGYDVFWKTKLSPIQMPDGLYHYIFFIIKGKL